jgi:GT2 family glycosyltransferase
VLFFEELDATGAPRSDPRHVPFHNAALQSATLRTDGFRGFGPLDVTLGFAEDVDFFLRLLEADSRLILESEIACFYRYHPGNMTRDLRGKQQGYVQAYARSLARRRAAGRTRPVKRFFPRQFERDTEFGGGHVLQTLAPTAEHVGLLPFINAFYLRYWRELTDLETLSVRLEASGYGSIRVGHRRPDGARTVMRDVALDGERTTLSLEIELGDPAQDGVLDVDVDDHVVVHAGSWVTFDEPRQDVQLAIVICSLNQPEAVAESLERLAGAQARVIVVHQGDAELTVPVGVEVVRQPNFGGSGGFARGMIEALDGGASHVLLLDDDVRLHPDVPARLRSLLAHLKRPTTIGGQMLKLSRPTELGASHETVDLQRMRLCNPLGGVDLARPDATSMFTRRHVSDYNGWWCCCVPAQTVRAALPLPMFVRHDDVEHGLRTTRSGSEVVTMPGIFVWHKSFDSKIKLWYTYYDRRNKLIVAALHGTMSGRRLAGLFLSDCWGALTLHRYDLCWAACRGARDFLAGPSVVFSDPRARHQEIVAGVARYALRTIQSDRARGGGQVSLVKSLRLPEVARPVRAIGGEMLCCGWGLLRRGDRVCAEYRATREHYSSPEFWRAYLGMAT